MKTSHWKQCVRHAGLLLGVLLSACSDKPRPPDGPGPGQLDIQAAQAVSPPGMPGDFDGDGNVDLLMGRFGELVLARGKGDGTFGQREVLATGFSFPVSAVGDLDKDGDLDFVSADEPGWRLRLFFNDGTGRFTPGAELGMQDGRLAATLADVDGDGFLDVLAVQDRQNLLTVWRSAGTGSLGTRVELPTPRGPNAVAAADLNGDGHPELLVASGASEPLEVIDVKSFTGAPVSRKQATVGYCWPVELAVGDFDKDADTDVALSCQGVLVLRNDGQGNLTLAQSLPSGGITHGLAVADIDKDGALDLVLSDHAQGPTLFKGSGDGSFRFHGSWATHLMHDTLQASLWRLPGLYVVDVDKDGQLDLLAGTNDWETYALLRGDGSGGFRGSEAKLLEPRAWVQLIGDISGDGIPDLIAQGQVFINGPDGTFQAFASAYTGTSFSTRVVDVNGDGKSDVVKVFTGDAELWLSDGQTLTLSQTLRGATEPASGRRDINQDGIPDLDFGSTYAQGLEDGRFATQLLSVPTGPGPFIFFASTVYADFNKDGSEDLYTSNTATQQCYPSGHCDVFPQGPAVYLWNKDTARYEHVGVAPPLRAARALELTGDGIPDLTDGAQLARGLGDGKFASPEPLPAMSTLEKLRLGVVIAPLSGDVNGDGLTDVLELDGYWLNVKLGQEDGELAAPVGAYAPGFFQLYPDRLGLFDVDDDGLPELVRPTVQGIAVLKLARR